MTLLPRPGDLTVPFAGGPIDCYRCYPAGPDEESNFVHDLSSIEDGYLFVIAHVNSWLFVLSSSGKLGWIFEYDVGPGKIAGAVYHIDR